MRTWARPLLALGLVTAGALACGSSGQGSGYTSTGDGGGGGGGGGGDLDGGGFDFSDTGGGGGGGGDAAACSAPVDMFIMFDRSGSMGTDCDVGGTAASKWCRSINALSGYFKSQGATDQAAALQFFPIITHSDALCATGTGYDVAALPTTAPAYTPLPTNAFDALLNATSPGGGGGGGGLSAGTPTEAAIRGLVKFTAANRRPARVTIGILITDGDPNGCNETLTFLSDLLAAHNQATQIRTYVIGMQGATFANLEAIAQGGAAPLHPDVVGSVADACGNGAGPCRHWNVGDGDPAAFTAALAAIQDLSDGCKDGGGYVNPTK